MSDPNLETALRQMEVTANNFAMRLARSAAIRAEYVERIRAMSQDLREAVAAGQMSARKGAELANQRSPTRRNPGDQPRPRSRLPYPE